MVLTNKNIASWSRTKNTELIALLWFAISYCQMAIVEELSSNYNFYGE